MALSFLKRQMTGLALLALMAAPVLAQDFSPRLYVNDRVITQFEVDQRIEFLRVLRSPGDLEEEALTGLVEDRLRQTAEQTAGLAPGDIDEAPVPNAKGLERPALPGPRLAGAAHVLGIGRAAVRERRR